jgi:hypothetical protein
MTGWQRGIGATRQTAVLPVFLRLLLNGSHHARRAPTYYSVGTVPCCAIAAAVKLETFALEALPYLSAAACSFC